jgi:murein DD-endopeptidase MepM/ murein hydrolase activator NlpD
VHLDPATFAGVRWLPTAIVCTSLVLVAAPAAGAVSGNVAALQVALRGAGLYDGTVDGIAGPATAAATAAFQRRHGLVADGIAGPATRRAFGRRGRPAWGSRAMHQGQRGWDVAVLQFKLALHGFPSGPMDGGFGPRVDAALRAFQSWAGLGADGIAGPATRSRLQAAPPRSPLRFYRPVAAAVGDRFGPRGARMHTGVDFPVDAGTPVGAAGRGCVVRASYDPGGYGNLVVIQHRLGVTTWYAHLRRFSVRAGDCVTGGERVGLAGATGSATGPHLHFEIRVRGAAVDPLGAFL